MSGFRQSRCLNIMKQLTPPGSLAELPAAIIRRLAYSFDKSISR